MKNGNTLLFLLALSFLTAGCRNETDVPFNNPQIVYQGRIDTSQQVAVFYWPGTSAKIYLKGQGSIYALLKDEKGKNYYNIILNNDSIRILHPDTAKRYYLLAANLPEGKHVVEIFKRTGWDKGNTWFYGFRLKDSLQLVSPPKAKRLKLEFYGNSITVGYAVDDEPTHSHPDSIYTNNYDSYGHYRPLFSCQLPQHQQKWYWYNDQLVSIDHARNVWPTQPCRFQQQMEFFRLRT